MEDLLQYNKLPNMHKYKIIATYALLLIAVLPFYRSHLLELSAICVLLLVLVISTYTDLSFRRVPNVVSYLGIIAGAVYGVINIFQPLRFHYGIWWSPFFGMVFISGVMLGISIISDKFFKTYESIGMGDIKLFAVIGLIMGWQYSFLVFAATMLFAGMGGTIEAVRTKNIRVKLPLVPFILAGTVLVVIAAGINM